MLLFVKTLIFVLSIFDAMSPINTYNIRTYTYQQYLTEFI